MPSVGGYAVKNVDARAMTPEPEPILSCGHGPSPHSPSTTGTATTEDGREICWSCADGEIRAAIERTALGAPLPVLYLTKSATGQAVLTTWSGGTMLHVTRRVTARVNAFGPFRQTRVYLRAEDEHGARFYGTSPGFGMFARVRKAKRQK